MPIPVRSFLMSGVAVVTASALVVAPSIRPPALELVASRAVELSATVTPLISPSDNVPSLVDEIRMGIVPSLGAAFPAPPIPGPSPVTTNVASAIQNAYLAIEPWVRYGFEVATYAVGWVPYVGWLSGQIMIFYNFGERIVRSLVFNSTDWLSGVLPFGQGLRNVAQDSWNALVQLGIDQWNFWLPPLPPLPPLPFAAQQTTTPVATLTTAQRKSGATRAQVVQSLRERFGLPDTGGADATVHGLITQVEQALGTVGSEAASIRTAVTEAMKDATRTLPVMVPFGGTSAPDLYRTNTAPLDEVLQAPNKAAAVKALRQSAPSGKASAKRLAVHPRPRGEMAKTHNSVLDSARKKSTPD
jgi:hypothetical protein